MFRGSLLLVSLIAGCTFGAPNGNGNTDGMPDGSGDGSSDRDGDGVLDATDNCPDIANPPLVTQGAAQPIQRDHDGDGRGDECDLCPHLSALSSPKSNMDTDGDSIGDACDPEPTMANPEPYWNGFYEAPDTSWMRTAGGSSDWELAERDGKLGWRQKTLDGGRHQLVHMQPHEETFVQTSIVVEAMQPSTNDFRTATVSFGFEKIGPPPQDAYYSCGLLWNPTGDASAALVGLQHDDSFVGTTMKTTSWTGSFVNKTIDVTGRGDRTGPQQPGMGGTALGCDLSDGTMAKSTTSTSTTRPDGQVGLRTFGMTAWFDYIFVVEPHEPREP